MLRKYTVYSIYSTYIELQVCLYYCTLLVYLQSMYYSNYAYTATTPINNTNRKILGELRPKGLAIMLSLLVSLQRFTAKPV